MSMLMNFSLPTFLQSKLNLETTEAIYIRAWMSENRGKAIDFLSTH